MSKMTLRLLGKGLNIVGPQIISIRLRHGSYLSQIFATTPLHHC
jgi:hypothetical protein